MQISTWILVVVFIAGVSACKSDDDAGGAGTNAGGGAGGTTGGVGGATAGAGGTTGGAGGAAGAMSGGMGGATGGVGGVAGVMSGGMGGMAGGGAGGMTGGMGGMGGMGGTTGGMGGMTGGMGGGEPDASMTDTATFTDVYDILEMRCGGGDFGCHVMGVGVGLGMQSKMIAFEELVGMNSEADDCVGEVRVIAGDADNSLIIKALEGTAECIDQMPDGRDPLPAEEIATIREWIEAGAMDN